MATRIRSTSSSSRWRDHVLQGDRLGHRPGHLAGGVEGHLVRGQHQQPLVPRPGGGTRRACRPSRSPGWRSRRTARCGRAPPARRAAPPRPPRAGPATARTAAPPRTWPGGPAGHPGGAARRPRAPRRPASALGGRPGAPPRRPHHDRPHRRHQRAVEHQRADDGADGAQHTDHAVPPPLRRAGPGHVAGRRTMTVRSTFATMQRSVQIRGTDLAIGCPESGPTRYLRTAGRAAARRFRRRATPSSRAVAATAAATAGATRVVERAGHDPVRPQLVGHHGGQRVRGGQLHALGDRGGPGVEARRRRRRGRPARC